MRILWLSHLVPYPPKAGVLQRCYYLLRELGKYHDIDLISFVQKDLMLSFYDNCEEGLEESRKALSPFLKNIDYFDITSEDRLGGKAGLAMKSFFSTAGYTMNWLYSKNFSNHLEVALRENDYDLVHFDTISLAVYRNQIQNIPTSLDHHNIESHMMIRRAKKEKNWLKKMYFYQEGIKLDQQEKKWCPEFDINITCSKMDSERLIEVVGDIAAKDIPNGVDVEYFKPLGSPKRRKSLIFIGTMNWYPNVEAVEYILKQIWPALRKIHPDATLDIIGSSPNNWIKSHDGKDGVTVHGFVDDIRPMFDSAHVYICPIMDGGGTKLKILDALAMGKAIVSSPIACEGIEVTNGKNVIFCQSRDEYLENIDKLFVNQEEQERLERNARELAENRYSFDKIGLSLSKLLTTISESQ